MEEQLRKRTFQIWDYNVSHQQMLIRSPKSESSSLSENIDIIFWGVRFVESIALFRGIEIEPATEEDTRNLNSEWLSENSPYEVFVIVSMGKRYKIVAVNMKVTTNDLDIFETSLKVP